MVVVVVVVLTFVVVVVSVVASNGSHVCAEALLCYTVPCFVFCVLLDSLRFFDLFVRTGILFGSRKRMQRF